MSTISIENMKFYAYHGCFEEEQTIGTNFSLDIYLDCDSSLAEKTDNVMDTVDYSKVYLVIKEEMNKPSHLLEHVARRIVDEVHSHFPTITRVKLTIRKLNPPILGHMDHVGFTLEESF